MNMMLAVDLSYKPFIMLKYGPAILIVLSGFIRNEC